jgi:hypothetical protein
LLADQVCAAHQVGVQTAIQGRNHD